MALIEISDVHFAFPGAASPALRGVTLSIEEGQRVALVGANGSGKTTLARLINALYLPTAGSVTVAGMDTRRPELHRAIRQVVGMVFQNPEDQLVAAVVEEDLAFGLENLGVPSAEMRLRVDAALKEFELWEHRLRPPHMLSGGQMQRLALAGVLVVEPRVVIFDETTAMLDPAGRRAVLDGMARLHEKGATLIAITHFMGEAARAQRVVALSGGQVALDAPPAEFFSDPARLAALGLQLPPAAELAARLRPYLPGLPGGLLNTSDLLEAISRQPEEASRQLSAVSRQQAGDSSPSGVLSAPQDSSVPPCPRGFLSLPAVSPSAPQDSSVPPCPRGFPSPPAGFPSSPQNTSVPLCLRGFPSPSSAESEIITIEDLGHIYMKDTPLAHRALAGANLRAAAGRVHGLAGSTGSGKSTLLQHINGLLRPQEGRVRVGELQLDAPTADLEDARRQAGLAFQNPEVQLFETFAGDEIAYGPRQAGLERPAVREAVRWAMEQVGLDFETFKDRRTFALSGGEKKKVALASVLARRPRLLLLDEPLAGLDPRSRAEVLAALRRLAGQGMTLVVSSHQMDDLAGLADCATVMHAGRDAFSGPAGEVFTREDELLAAGLEAPVAARAALELRRAGWPIPEGIVTPEALEAALAQEAAR